jgi:hypothetical protein
MQTPAHALSQHTPSLQKPLEHSSADVQLDPCGSFATQAPASQ